MCNGYPWVMGIHLLEHTAHDGRFDADSTASVKRYIGQHGARSTNSVKFAEMERVTAYGLLVLLKGGQMQLKTARITNDSRAPSVEK